MSKGRTTSQPVLNLRAYVTGEKLKELFGDSVFTAKQVLAHISEHKSDLLVMKNPTVTVTAEVKKMATDGVLSVQKDHVPETSERGKRPTFYKVV